MKKILLTSILATSICGMAQEEKTYKHVIAPKGFFRKHHESKYTYKTAGIGFEYYLHRPQGLGYKINLLSNINTDTTLIESEQRIHYRIPVKDSFNLCPFISSRYSTHKWLPDEENPMHIIKSGMFLGFISEYSLSDSYQLAIDLSIFRDMQNSLIVSREDEFWGRSFSNPAGIKGKIGMLANWMEDCFLNLECYYSRTFRKCYDELGCEFSIKWSY